MFRSIYMYLADLMDIPKLAILFYSSRVFLLNLNKFVYITTLVVWINIFIVITYNSSKKTTIWTYQENSRFSNVQVWPTDHRASPTHIRNLLSYKSSKVLLIEYRKYTEKLAESIIPNSEMP